MPTIPSSQNLSGVTQVIGVKDMGRSSRNFTLDGYQTVQVAEILNTVNVSADGAAPVGATSYTVTAGKRLRLKSILATLLSVAGNTTPVTVIVRIRMVPVAPALIASPVQIVFALPGIAVANSASDPVMLSLPDGFEIPAGAGIGVTTTCPGYVVTTAAPIVTLSMMGFEF